VLFKPRGQLFVVQALWATALQEFAVVHMAALSTSATNLLSPIHKNNHKLQELKQKATTTASQAQFTLPRPEKGNGPPFGSLKPAAWSEKRQRHIYRYAGPRCLNLRKATFCLSKTCISLLRPEKGNVSFIRSPYIVASLTEKQRILFQNLITVALKGRMATVRLSEV
jgi:hypothetical protein